MVEWSWFSQKDNVIKEVTIVLLFVTTFLVSILPRFLSSRLSNAGGSLFSVLNSLAGGVVLGAAFSHMLPSARKSFEDFLVDYPEKVKNYPFSFVCAAISLLVLISVDKIFIGANHSHDLPHETQRRKELKSYAPSSPKSSFIHTHKKNGEYVTLPSESEDEREEDYDDAHTSRDLIEGLPNDSHSINVVHVNTHSEEKKEQRSKLAQAYVFLFAISFHSVFEGLGMGSEDNSDGVISMMLAVISHKWLEAFALGCSIHFTGFSNLILCLILFLYACTTPLGIGIGMALGNIMGKGGEIASAILISLAAGSFLYIGLIEILPTELGKPKFLHLKLLLVWVGWGTMSAVAYWV